jgi:hypothetical protein
MKTRTFFQNVLTLIVACFSVCITANGQTCSAAGNQTASGSNNVWIGHVYQGTSFNTYAGTITRGNASSPDFDESFGGNRVTFNTSSCPIVTDTFSVRFRLSKNFTNAEYIITVGGDDGYRLSLDGGATWAINNWNDHGYTTSSYTVRLSGNVELVLEYYERFINNRVSFKIETGCEAIGEETAFGNSEWIGHMYQGRKFNSYKGSVKKGSSIDPNFDENFGGADVEYNTNSCKVRTQSFAARFKMKRNLPAGNYVITIGGDDGYRLSLDGGNTWVIDQWRDQSYKVSSYSAPLSGTYDMVLEYYENGGDNRLSFGMSAAMLPVKLLNWQADSKASGVVLQWKSAQEVNFSHYIVERSENGQAFTAIGYVSATGSPAQVRSYSFTDVRPMASTVYYRLAMVDISGEIRYSSVLAVNKKASVTSASVYPTVISNGAMNVTAPDNSIVRVYDMTGRVLLNSQLTSGGANRVELKNNSFSRGSYVVTITERNEVIGKQIVVVK